MRFLRNLYLNRLIPLEFGNEIDKYRIIRIIYFNQTNFKFIFKSLT